MRIQSTWTKRATVAAILGAGLSACSSETLFVANRAKLSVAFDNVEAGEPQTVVTQMESLIAETADESEMYALQRFFASYLLTRAHIDASFGESFLTESLAQSGSSFSLEGGTFNSNAQPSPVSHQVAATYHASLGRKWFGFVRDAELTAEGENLLPETLENFSAQNANAYLALAMFTVFSRFEFQDRIEDVVNGIPQLLDLDACDQLLELADASAPMRPWVYHGVFAFLREVDEVSAFKFGIKTMQTAHTSNDTMKRHHTGAIERWITDESEYHFICGKGQCKQPVIPAEPRCLACQQTPTIDFLAVPKE